MLDIVLSFKTRHSVGIVDWLILIQFMDSLWGFFVSSSQRFCVNTKLLFPGEHVA